MLVHDASMMFGCLSSQGADALLYSSRLFVRGNNHLRHTGVLSINSSMSLGSFWPV